MRRVCARVCVCVCGGGGGGGCVYMRFYTSTCEGGEVLIVRIWGLRGLEGGGGGVEVENGEVFMRGMELGFRQRNCLWVRFN